MEGAQELVGDTGNRYRNGFDPIGLENGGKCPCGESYAVFAFTRAERMQETSDPDHPWPDSYLPVWGGRVRETVAALITKFEGKGGKPGGRVKLWIDHANDTSSPEAEKASEDLRADQQSEYEDALAEDDPCREMFVFYGHGGSRQDRNGQSSIYFFNGSVSTLAGNVFQGSPNSMRVIALFACWQTPAHWVDPDADDADKPAVVAFTGETPTGNPDKPTAPGGLATATPEQRAAHQKAILKAIGGGR